MLVKKYSGLLALTPPNVLQIIVLIIVVVIVPVVETVIDVMWMAL